MHEEGVCRRGRLTSSLLCLGGISMAKLVLRRSDRMAEFKHAGGFGDNHLSFSLVRLRTAHDCDLPDAHSAPTDRLQSYWRRRTLGTRIGDCDGFSSLSHPSDCVCSSLSRAGRMQAEPMSFGLERLSWSGRQQACSRGPGQNRWIAEAAPPSWHTQHA